MRRIRTWWACVSILFNQTIHLGNAPYPYSLSETCWIRRHRLRYAIGRAIIDTIFRVFGEADHCELAFYTGRAYRAKTQY